MRKALFSFLSASLMCAALAQGASAQEYAQRKETNMSVKLAPGARVEVSGIGGPVQVETGDGDSADVNIVRTAVTAEELACADVNTRATPDYLEIRHVQHSGRPGCQSIRARQSVRLRVPRGVELTMTTVAGEVTVGRVEGSVALSNIAGRVRIDGARSVDLSNLASGLDLRLSGAAGRGARVSNVVGHVELRLAQGMDADVRVSNVVGEVRSDAADIEITRTGTSAYRARAGAGGRVITVSNVSGLVTISR